MRVIVFVFVAAAAAWGQAGYPDVALDHKPMFDTACAEATKEPIDPAAVRELQERLGEFREFWRKEQPKLLGAVPAVTGVPFKYREAKAALFVCGGYPSMSLPLMINMRPYLAATSRVPPAPMVDFSNVILHEVLHRYVGECLEALPGRTTKLLQKYSDEPPPVRNHLHLYAVMLLVYRKLGREKDLDAVWATEKRFPKAWAVSQRAREIITEEGAENFARELGGGPAPKKGKGRGHAA